MKMADKCRFCGNGIDDGAEFCNDEPCLLEVIREQSEQIATDTAALAASQAKVERYKRLEKISREICEVVETGAVVRTAKGCKHGNYATAPYNHAWFCDDCWIEMQEALRELS